MQLYPLKLITIICETLLMKKVCEECQELGATGYTRSEVEGSGPRNYLNAQAILKGNMEKVEFVVEPETANKILLHISRKYFENYSVAAWVATVEVVHGKDYIKQ
jgi:nitrogen regulatory protein PII